MVSISSFPMIDTELIRKIRIQFSPYRFWYIDDSGDEQELHAEDDGSSLHPLVDEHGCWSADEKGFCVSRTCCIRSASFLFGGDGVACKNATLVLALLCKSPDSRQRLAFEISEIENSSEYQEFKINRLFPNPCFRGRLDLQVAIILKKDGTPNADEMHLANIPGTVLGIVDSFSVLFDGAGSMFPISVVNDKDALLWSVECNFDDPLLDKFSDCILIKFNRAHKDFKYINKTDKGNFNPSFLREVLAGALATIVDCVRESDSWDSIKNGHSDMESVGQVVYYFVSTLNLNLDDAKQCSMAFRDYFERKLGEL